MRDVGGARHSAQTRRTFAERTSSQFDLDMTTVNIPTQRLSDGRELPVLGFGTWFGFDHKFKFDVTDMPRMVDALSHAIDVGYRHVDTAHLYRIEPEVGKLVNQKIKDGVVRREDLFITTKVWQCFHREADATQSVRDSLRRLQLDYVDLALIHFPMSYSVDGVDEKIDFLETWRGMEAALRHGLTKSIGVSNFSVEQLTRLLANCEVPPVCNQIEVNLNLGQNELVEFCRSRGIAVVAYSPLGTMVAERSPTGSPPPKLDDPTMLTIAQKHGKTVPQIALKYLVQRGFIVITKTMQKSRVVENASIFDFTLDEADVEQLAKFDVGYRSLLPVVFQDFTHYPFERVPDFDASKAKIPPSLLAWKNGYDLDIE